MEDNGIFTNKEQVVEGLRESAKAVGLNPDLVAPNDDQKRVRHLAKKSCKRCCGRGTMRFVPSPQKQKLFWENKGRSRNITPRRPHIKQGPSRPRQRVFTGFSPANEELTQLWDDRKLDKSKEKFRGTSMPEPPGYKREVVQDLLCGCVKIEEI